MEFDETPKRTPRACDSCYRRKVIVAFQLKLKWWTLTLPSRSNVMRPLRSVTGVATMTWPVLLIGSFTASEKPRLMSMFDWNRKLKAVTNLGLDARSLLSCWTGSIALSSS